MGRGSIGDVARYRFLLSNLGVRSGFLLSNKLPVNTAGLWTSLSVARTLGARLTQIWKVVSGPPEQGSGSRTHKGKSQ